MRRFTPVLAAVAALALLVLPAAAQDDGADDDLYRIPFSSGTVDPARDWTATEPAGHDLVLVQWERFGDSDVVHEIAATGALLVQPLAPVNYLVWADAAQTRAIRGLDGVRFAGVLPPEVRIAANVESGTTMLRVTVVGAGDLLGLPEVSVRPRAFTQIPGAVVTIPGSVSDARLLAQNPRVYSIADVGDQPQLRDEQSSQIVAQGTEEGANEQPGYRDFLDEIGADGAGVIVSIVDGGVDGNHPDLLGKVAECFDYSNPVGALCVGGNTDDAIGHGTHVLGNILANGTTPLGDLDGFSYGLGLAPGAQAVTQNAISLNTIPANILGQGPFANGYTPVYTDAVRAGAIVSNNSWGPAGSPQGYDSDTREFDQIARDADPETPGDQMIGLSWSIMNGSGGTSTQGSPDEAKNIIAVGGTGARNRSPDDLCTCTAHGPNLDGRQLVDIVAPAQNVVSTRAAQGGVCGNPALAPTAYTPPSPIHGPCTGTSFASPHVTGAYAVFVDWYRENVAGDEAVTPSPTLVKAAMINTADDLSVFGGRDANNRSLTPIPNDQQGWGRVNLGNLIGAWSAGVVFVDQTVVFTSSGESHTLTVEPLDPDKPLKVTLVWADAPGHGQGGELPAWVNDLDLVVTSAGGDTWLGNDFADGWSTTGGEADRMNNVENVYLAAPGAGAFTVTVDAANIIGQASPNADSPTWQDFALVVSNARLVE